MGERMAKRKRENDDVLILEEAGWEISTFVSNERNAAGYAQKYPGDEFTLTVKMRYVPKADVPKDFKLTRVEVPEYLHGEFGHRMKFSFPVYAPDFAAMARGGYIEDRIKARLGGATPEEVGLSAEDLQKLIAAFEDGQDPDTIHLSSLPVCACNICRT